MNRIAAALLVPALLPAALALGDAAKEPARPKAFVIVFDFVSPDGNKFGKKLSDSLRLRLRRHKDCEVISRLETQEASAPLGVGTDPRKAIKLMRERVGANLGAYGTVQLRGGLVRAEVRVVDLTGKKPAVSTQIFSDNTERAKGVVARKIVEAIRRGSEWAPPEYGDETEPTKTELPKPLNGNGDFEAGHAAWDAPDNVVTFIERGPKGRGKVLRFQTDVARDPWLAYRRRLMFGQADPSKPPKIPRDDGYSSVAGLEGAHFRGKWLDAAAGQRYWLVADMRGRTSGIFFPKVFVKGFLDYSARADGLPETSLVERKLTPKQFAALGREKRKRLIAEDAKAHPDRYRRECFRWYLACRNEEDVWRHYAAPFPPRGGLPKNVKWLRIEVFAYWPPGKYLFDNVHLYKDPRQKKPLPEVKPRTPNFGKQADEEGTAK